MLARNINSLTLNGLLLAKTTDAGSLIRVYFWAEDVPIAQMDTELTYLYADHPDTPRIGTNSSAPSYGNGTMMPLAADA